MSYWLWSTLLALTDDTQSAAAHELHQAQQHLAPGDAPGQAVPDVAVGTALQGQHLQQLLHAVHLVLQGLLHGVLS